MDTVPFHFVMFALDLVLVIGFSFWPSQKGTRWALGGTVLFGLVGIIGIGVIAKLFKTNVGQCAVEGLAYHGSVFLLIAAYILCTKERYFVAFLNAMLGIAIFAAGFDMLVLEPYSLAVEHYEIESPKIKKPMRIVFVADIQTDRIGSHERRTLELIEEQKADLIILGGDYLQYFPGTRGVDGLHEQFRKLFVEIPLTAPLGVFALNGNVDVANSSEFADLFKDTGVETIFFSTIIDDLGIDKGFSPIDLVLLSMVDSVDGVQERALSDSGNFVVVAGHYPIYAIKDYEHADRAPDLMLAGHTHGGQVCIPGYGPVSVKTTKRDVQIPQNRMNGMYHFDNGGHLLISRGTGMERGWAPRVRFFCRPEISVIDLKPAP